MDTKPTIKHIPIFYACDDYYAPFMATSMASILFNTTSPVDFYILDCGISAIKRRKLEMMRTNPHFSGLNMQFININTDEYFGHIELRNNLTPACFARFLIPELFPGLQKILYLDCDTIALDDITSLYNEPLNGHIIGAVISADIMDNLQQKLSIYRGAALSAGHQYFNSGVLLIDINKWNTNNTTDCIIAAEQTTANARTYNDQDILNHTFDSDFQALDLKYNVRSSLLSMYEIPEVTIRHFTGGLKPWLRSGFLMPHASDFWFYTGLTPFFAELMANGVGDPVTSGVQRVIKM